MYYSTWLFVWFGGHTHLDPLHPSYWHRWLCPYHRTLVLQKMRCLARFPIASLLLPFKWIKKGFLTVDRWRMFAYCHLDCASIRYLHASIPSPRFDLHSHYGTSRYPHAISQTLTVSRRSCPRLIQRRFYARSGPTSLARTGLLCHLRIIFHITSKFKMCKRMQGFYICKYMYSNIKCNKHTVNCHQWCSCPAKTIFSEDTFHGKKRVGIMETQ